MSFLKTDKISIYIFAGGKNERWDADYPKEVATVDGVPVVRRTVDLVRQRGLEPTAVVTDKQEVIDACDCSIESKMGETLAESIFLMSWADHNVVLLGDVYYSVEAIDTIFNTQCFTFGILYELFALRWMGIDQIATSSISQAVKDFQFEVHGVHGKLWDIYRNYAGLERGKHNVEKLNFNHLKLIEDETDDFDTVERYETWLKKHNKNA